MRDRRIRVLLAFGTRPEAIKMVPLIKELRRRSEDFDPIVAVTGQHKEMLSQVLDLFEISPHYDLSIMKERQRLAEITSRSLEGLDRIIGEVGPDLVLVHGDATTSLAGSLAAYYHRIPVGHVEAGLRSGDKFRPFPEEMNRRIADMICDMHFAPTGRARENLISEGVDPAWIFVTGNTVIDALLDISSRDIKLDIGPLEGRVLVATAHRRESWGKVLENICLALKTIVERFEDVTLVFPAHRNPVVRETARRILGGTERVIITDPPDYGRFVALLKRSYLILTDSGGIQEEAPSLGKPVLVMREVTEREEAVRAGTARVVGIDAEKIVEETSKLLQDEEEYRKMATRGNPYGDGKASLRIADAILYRFGRRDSPPDNFEG